MQRGPCPRSKASFFWPPSSSSPRNHISLLFSSSPSPHRKAFLPHTPPQMPPHTPPQLPPPPYPSFRYTPESAPTAMKPDLRPPLPEPFSRKHPLLRPHHKTSPFIWCAAIVCVVLTLILILAGIIALIFFLVIKPRNPSLDLAAASLNSIYIDSPTYFNGDFSFLANFSNPNHKIDLVFSDLGFQLYFRDRLIAVQVLQPFAQRTGESRLESVHMVSSEVPLPPELALELQRQVRMNSVVYSVRGAFKVKASLGVGHYSYSVYTRCDVELTAPPNGVLVARRCKTKS